MFHAKTLRSKEKKLAKEKRKRVKERKGVPPDSYLEAIGIVEWPSFLRDFCRLFKTFVDLFDSSRLLSISSTLIYPLH